MLQLPGNGLTFIKRVSRLAGFGLALVVIAGSGPMAFANCVDTPPFDDDWGWNDSLGDSCRLSAVDAAPVESAAGVCIDTPPFDDDWGWNSTLADSCRLSGSSTATADVGTGQLGAGICVDTPPFDDDWGWNQVLGDSCRLSPASTNETVSGDTTNTAQAGNCVDTPPFDDEWGWDAVRGDSCRLTAASGDSAAGNTVTGACIDSAPFDDNWGWNQALGESCQLDANDSPSAQPGYSAYPYAGLNAGPRVEFDWTPALRRTWNGIKRRSVDSYSVPLIHRPRSELPGDAVSEGVGYGMILALYSNDQTYFNRIWDAGERYLWNGQYYDWRAAEDGTTIGFGAATDAEQDIAMMLIFADDLVNRGIWQAGHTSPQGVGYAERAQVLLNLIWNDMVDGGRYLRPGNAWGGRNLLNPGYFAPAWYRLYARFDAEPAHNWRALIDQSYQTIAASPGYSRGLVPDWSDAWGGLLPEGPGYNAYDDGHSMYKDGIRTLWRIATDAMWFGDARAISYLRNALGFLERRASDSGSADNPNSPAHLANFFQMNGAPVPATDIWTEFNGGNSERSRSEHSHLTIAMWATAAMGAGNMAAAESLSRELQTFYEGGDFFGLTVDPSGNNEDIAHNELYFDQFLAWFGASLLNGNFCNPQECISR